MSVFSRKLGVYLVAFVVFSAECSKASLHRVGGGQYTWSPSSNFTAWASREQFYVGDWLYFGFDKTIHNVLEVNKTSYEKCIATDFITNITRGGRDVFNLTQAREYFFLCSRGHCEQGMKVAISVQDAPPKTNATLPPRMAVSYSTSKTDRGHHILQLLLAWLWTCLFNYTWELILSTEFVKSG